MTLLDRILDRTIPEPNTGCLLWLGATNRDGYAHIKLDGRTEVHGPIAHGLDVDHKCRVRSCVNPAHLEAVSTQENVLRGHHPNVLTLRLGRCRRGHSMTPDNIYASTGGRQCRACVLMNRARRKELVHA